MFDPVQAKRAWDEAVPLLKNAGMSDASARKFFGNLLSRNKLNAGQMLDAVLACKNTGTQDPRGYLTKAAQGVKAGAEDPALRADWT